MAIGTPSLGVVQTAYANGAAAAFLHSKGVEVAFAKTGVKYVHHAAEAFDVGVYFEANGHGTVLVKEALRARLAQLDREPGTGGRARLAVSPIACGGSPREPGRRRRPGRPLAGRGRPLPPAKVDRGLGRAL